MQSPTSSQKRRRGSSSSGGDDPPSSELGRKNQVENIVLTGHVGKTRKRPQTTQAALGAQRSPSPRRT